MASTTFDQAIELAQQGKSVEGEALLDRILRGAIARHGERSYEAAAGHSDLAMFLTRLRQIPRAIEHMRAACNMIEPSEPAQMKEYLTHHMNFGELLSLVEKHAEAEAVLRKGLAGRLKFYGREHAGYAFGLEPLADCLMRQEKFGAAREMLEEAVANLFRNGNPRLAQTMVIRAEALGALGQSEDLFPEAPQLPDNMIEEICQATMGRVEITHPKLLRRILPAVAELAEQRLGETHTTTLNMHITLMNHESTLEDCDHGRRLAAGHKCVEIMKKRGEDVGVAQALMGLALAQSAAGDNDAALASYEFAEERARAGGPAMVSQVQRNKGLLLRDMKDDVQAEAVLRGAIETVAAGTSPEEVQMRGRAQGALGIFIQHQSRFEEARPLLESAVQILPASFSEAVQARGHLSALDTNRPCGCGDTGKALAIAFREYVLERLPQDLLSTFDVAYNPESNNFDISVHLQREPKPEEIEQLNRVIEHAMAEFRQKIITRA
jgi:tetratricopeptide (TPR) repeat protein